MSGIMGRQHRRGRILTIAQDRTHEYYYSGLRPVESGPGLRRSTMKGLFERCPLHARSSLLDHGTVRDGIGKRHTQFNDISPGLF